jgi:hypothetical protein
VAAEAVIAPGQLTTGGVVSRTRKIVVHVLLLLDPSLTVTVMMFVPKPTSVPAGGF